MAPGPWDLRTHNNRQHTKWRLFTPLADVDNTLTSTSYHSSDHYRDFIDNKSGTGARRLNMFLALVKYEDIGYGFKLY